ncbi:polymerase [Actinophytocola xinjiangensis]|uniref:Polymerase n=1 Tax=Actinophytocola xinjiangensis TaxID=485602 RepID=A0A7Z0WPJ4_9PSEU|nr:O-antigen ligase family protein [Actinophytocola xinjiangensis]OLF12305.1 polymerase [Actinophytocola xinjiangensis]
MTRVLPALACLTVALAPLEGYLAAVHRDLGKVPAALLVVVWAVTRLRERRPPAWHPVHLLLAGLTLVALLSSAVHAGEPFTAEYLGRWLPFLALTVVLADVAAREAAVVALLASAVAGASVAGAGALVSVAAGAARATGPLPDPNDLAFVLVAALPLVAAVLPGRPSPVERVLAAGAVGLLVAGTLATFSRGGLLALAAAVVWLVWRRVLPVRVLAVSVAGLAVAGVAAMAALGPALTRALREKSFIAESNVDTRELRWRAAARMLGENPVLGVGPGGFRSEYVTASRNAELAEPTPVAHNMYLEVAAEFGLPALVLFLGLAAAALVATERAVRHGPDRRTALAVQASLVAVLVAATFLSEQYYLPLWLLVAVALSIEKEGAARAGTARDH